MCTASDPLGYKQNVGWLCLFVEGFGLGALGRDFFCFGPGFPYIVEETVPKTNLQTKWPGAAVATPMSKSLGRCLQFLLRS